MRCASRAGLVDAGSRPAQRALQPFVVMERSSAPDIGDTVPVIPEIPVGIPFFGSYNLLAIDREIGPVGRASILVRIRRELLHHLAWWPVPKPVLSQILASRRISDPAGLVGFGQRNAGALPLIAKPPLHAHRTFNGLDLQASLIEDTDLGHNGEAPDGLAVDVASDVSDPLVPRDQLHVVPAVVLQERMNRRPPDLGVPEPESRGRRCCCRPRCYVGLIPLSKRPRTDSVTVETPHAVGTVADDDRGSRPAWVYVEHVSGIEIEAWRRRALVSRVAHASQVNVVSPGRSGDSPYQLAGAFVESPMCS